ncbi:MAG: adenylyltransferase/cytidyltransferase family protein [Candidatus Woesearchaeota archaeon]
MKKVMVFGTFNIIHPGHLHLFRQAKKYGEKLIVVLARDYTVKDLKGYEPLTEIDRREKLLKIPTVDEVIFGNIDDKMKVVKDNQPDAICLGYDQSFFVEELEGFLNENNLNIPIIRLNPYKQNIYKSSKLKKDKLNE